MPRRDPFALSRLHPLREVRRLEVYQVTGSDGEAGRLLRIPVSAFAAWRMRRRLPARHPKPGKPVLSTREQARRRAAYDAAPGDGEAAQMLGLARRAFTAWRQLHGLPPKRARASRVTPAEDARRLAAYHEAADDVAAAARLGMTHNGYKDWRRRKGLPSKGMTGPTVPDEEDQRRRQAYADTANDLEAAAQLGLTQSGFQRWRNKAGLPAKTNNGGLHVTPREQSRRMRAYQTGDSDAATAKRLGLKLSTYRGWRQAQGLPARRRTLRAP